MGTAKLKKRKKSKPSGLRKYWPHLTLKECELERALLSIAQDDKCAICGRPESDFKNRLAVDHNHRTKKVRGLLCFQCNKFRVGRNSLQSSYEVYQYLLKYDPEGG
jgi:uncharacterized protein with ParB-like and HNH nuclease domain